MNERSIDHPPAVPVLDYATYDADGLLPWVREAEESIDARAKPSKIRKFFRNANQAVRYFAKSMRRRYSPQNMSDRCALCGKANCLNMAFVEWKVEMRLKATEIKLSRELMSARFRTFHTLCDDCHKSWTTRIKRRRHFGWWMSGAIAFTWLLFAMWNRIILRSNQYRNDWFAVFPLVMLLVVVLVRKLSNRLLPGAYPNDLKFPPRLICRDLSALIDRQHATDQGVAGREYEDQPALSVSVTKGKEQA